MDFQYNDGGREDAGYTGDTRDCACRAVAIATERPYKDVYDEINEWAQIERPRGGTKRSSARTGVWMRTMKKYMESLGWKWVPTMGIGTGCQVHTRADELPKGRIIVRLSKHYAAVIDGVLNDTYDCTRDGTRCVYGYWLAIGG
jgi:hypothetical protein